MNVHVLFLLGSADVVLQHHDTVHMQCTEWEFNEHILIALT